MHHPRKRDDDDSDDSNSMHAYRRLPAAIGLHPVLFCYFIRIRLANTR